MRNLVVLTADHKVGNVQRNEKQRNETASTQRQVRCNDLKREAVKINKRCDDLKREVAKINKRRDAN